MNLENLRARRDKVLEFIVTAYIEAGIPIGSVTLSSRSSLDLSPATIRNIMRELEDMGYISQPHTSAGRVPTDLGYRYYIDRIMQREYLTLQERENVRSIYRMAGGEPQACLIKALKLLAEITGEVSVLLAPCLEKNLLKQIKLVSLGGGRAVAILIMDCGLIKKREFECPQGFGDFYMQKIAGFINGICANKPLSRIKDMLGEIVLSAEDASYYICKDALDMLEKIDFDDISDKLFLEGTYYLFKQPEFKDLDKTKRLLGIFHRKRELVEFMEENSVSRCRGEDYEGARVCIGKENVCSDMHDCSIVISDYGADDAVLGAIGLIGPTRMPYSRFIPLVDCFAGEISCMFGAKRQ